MDNSVPRKRKRIITLIIALIFFFASVIFSYAACGILWQTNTMEPDPDQSISEGLSIGISAVILILFFFIFDAACALITLVFGLISAYSDIKLVKIIAIIVSVLAPITAVFPLIFSRLIP